MNDYSARKSTLTLRVTDASGAPVKGAKVSAKLRKHEFLFGTGAFFLNEFTDPALPADERAYMDRAVAEWESVFNYGTLSFYLGTYEREQGHTLEAETLRGARYGASRGIALKGHPLVWHTLAAPWMYDWSEEKVLDYMLMRITREMTAFKDTVRYWDVINETVIMPEFVNEPAYLPRVNPITRLCVKMGRVPLIKTLFDHAHAVDPDATLLINDFNTSERYARVIADCLDAGVRIDTIGIQSHQHQGFWGMEKLAEVTERFERFGLPIHYTENTFVSGHLMPPEIVDLNDYVVSDWPSTPEGEARQTEDMMTMSRYLMSRPQVTGFTNWSFEERGAWLNAPCGLIYKDGTPKPALNALKRALATEWDTDVTLVTDDSGVCALTGFRGDYDITVNGKVTGITLSRDSETTVRG